MFGAKSLGNKEHYYLVDKFLDQQAAFYPVKYSTKIGEAVKNCGSIFTKYKTTVAPKINILIQSKDIVKS